ncbi:MAG TPA: tRNA adenosine(34) deaminase TadA [Woeseiaceae bacterium]|nr:tRNA adenosine(34) deaminase TadA [Woeseiaceae bacterium]
MTTTGGWSDADVSYMRSALELAAQAQSRGEVPVGAVVVAEQRAVACGHNRTLLDNDPTAHAEIVALRAAAVELGNHRLNDATLYVTLEPCIMCVGAMLHARIARVVFGAYDEKAGAAGSVIDLCNDRQLNHRLEVNGGLLREEGAALLSAFFESKRS